jgi:putrescine importer
MGAILIIAAFGSGLTGTLGAARLLFGMGRDGVLPKKFFGYLRPGSSTPTYNILLIGALAFIGAVVLHLPRIAKSGSAYEQAGYLLNFGAFLAFMGVNFACFWQFSMMSRPDYKKNLLRDAIIPLIGFLVCGYIWWNLNYLAKIVGGIWFALGLFYVGYKTNWFRSAPVMIDFSDQ